ncbi:hypothetical protein BVRB_4g080920 [Beta vulgaris subsp. vulgaris]|nr:hypothetical protein BVRB_4g080920 [Beta vulgaris subsp. vulgaris]
MLTISGWTSKELGQSSEENNPTLRGPLSVLTISELTRLLSDGTSSLKFWVWCDLVQSNSTEFFFHSWALLPFHFEALSCKVSHSHKLIFLNFVCNSSIQNTRETRTLHERKKFNCQAYPSTIFSGANWFLPWYEHNKDYNKAVNITFLRGLIGLKYSGSR